MAILTATEVTTLSNISCSAGTVTSQNLIPVVQERLTMMLNNYFKTDLYAQDTVTFNATARTIVASAIEWADYNIAAGDEIMLEGSYRNDGYYVIGSVTTSTITLATGSVVTDELSGRSVLVSVVKWPSDLKAVAARMCAYDYDVRPSQSTAVKSRSLGPLSESYTDGESDAFGYPRKITGVVDYYRILRMR